MSPWLVYGVLAFFLASGVLFALLLCAVGKRADDRMQQWMREREMASLPEPPTEVWREETKRGER